MFARRFVLPFRRLAPAPADPYAALFFAWLTVRTVVWFVACVATHPNVPLDVVELLGWGHAWRSGSPQHPPLTAWVAAAFARLSPGDAWGVYVASYLATTACLLAAWRVGRAYLPPAAALAAALALDGHKFLTWDGDEWNNNLSLNVGWALVVWSGCRAVHSGRLGWWAATGVAGGVALHFKYTAAFLLVPLAGYLVATAAGRRHLRGPGPYLAAALTGLVFLPHAVWVAANDYVTLRYAAARAADAGGWAAHVANPVGFLAVQAALLGPGAFVLWPLLRGRAVATPPAAGGAPDRAFLRAAVLGPVVLFVAYGAATGSQLRLTWGATFWTFFWVWVLAEAGRGEPDPASRRRVVRRWALVAGAILAAFVAKHTVEPHLTGRPTRIHFPGRPLAAEVTRRWDAQFPEPFRAATGEAWLAGNVAAYARHRPALHSDWKLMRLEFEPTARPWNDPGAVNAAGGVVVWDAAGHGADVPAAVRAAFPRAVAQPPVVLAYQTSAALPPVVVGLAFVPPGR